MQRSYLDFETRKLIVHDDRLTAHDRPIEELRPAKTLARYVRFLGHISANVAAGDETKRQTKYFTAGMLAVLDMPKLAPNRRSLIHDSLPYTELEQTALRNLGSFGLAAIFDIIDRRVVSWVAGNDEFLTRSFADPRSFFDAVAPALNPSDRHYFSDSDFSEPRTALIRRPESFSTGH